MTAGTYDLTTVAKVKAVMRISVSTYDDLLQTLITAVSDRMERIAGRKFVARDYIEMKQGADTIQLDNWPVIAVDRVASGTTNAISVSATGFARAQISVTSAGVRLVSVSTAGVRVVSSLTFATYPSMTLMAAAMSAVSGWSATALVSYPSHVLNPLTGVSALNETAYLTYPDGDWETFDISYDRGILSLTSDTGWPIWPGDSSRWISVEYRAGYETVPTDLEMLCNEMVQSLYESTKLNPALKSESLGDYSYTLANGLELTESQKAVLSRYKEIR